ncbi:MAG: hypothetical protein P4L22_00265 [Candidatus Babeliales bacterium]|nr:hypothetical protein [Candidatus Babeliales bacterium]
MKKITLYLLIIIFWQAKPAQESIQDIVEYENIEIEELEAVLNNLRDIQYNLNNLKIFQRRTGKLSSEGINLFHNISLALEKLEVHNISLINSPNILTIIEDEFWQLPDINSIDSKSKYYTKMEFVELQNPESLLTTKFINVMSGSLTIEGFVEWGRIYQNVLRWSYYILKEFDRADLKKYQYPSPKDLYDQYISYKSCGFENIFKRFSGKLDNEGIYFINTTLEILISVYQTYLLYLEHNIKL